MGIRELKPEDVTIKVIREREDISVQHAAKDMGDTANDFIAAVRKVRSKSVWGWCCVRVDATYKGTVGSAYLGCCSYYSKEDFIKNSGYYETMVKEAISELNKAMATKYEEIKELVEA